MKPVPIAQYLDHIGRMARAEMQSPRRGLFVDAPQAARDGAGSEPRAPLVFNRALLDAALVGVAVDDDDARAVALDRRILRLAFHL